MIIHPGEIQILSEELEECGVTGSAAARALGIPQSRVSNILRARAGITDDTALRLGRWLGTGPELRLNMQKDYELRVAEASVGQQIAATVQPIAASVSP